MRFPSSAPPPGAAVGRTFVLTPFLHLGDPNNPRDRTRRQYTRPALLELARSADRVFVQTEGERLALVERGVRPERLVLQGMGVDWDSCTGGDRRRARAAWGVGPDDVVIGHLANNSREKGSVDLLTAAERAWRQDGRFHLVLAGPEMPNFRRFWSGYGQADRVRRLGVLDETQKRNFFAGIDGFALPSRSDSFGIVLLEAWANGASNIGYRAGGVAWVIRHEEDGLLVTVRRRGRPGGGCCGWRPTPDCAGGWVMRRERTRREFGWEDKLRLVRHVYQALSQGGG